MLRLELWLPNAESTCDFLSEDNARIIIENDFVSDPIVHFFRTGDPSDQVSIRDVQNQSLFLFVEVHHVLVFLVACVLIFDFFSPDFSDCDENSIGSAVLFFEVIAFAQLRYMRHNYFWFK